MKSTIQAAHASLQHKLRAKICEVGTLTRTNRVLTERVLKLEVGRTTATDVLASQVRQITNLSQELRDLRRQPLREDVVRLNNELRAEQNRSAKHSREATKYENYAFSWAVLGIVSSIGLLAVGFKYAQLIGAF